MLELTLGRLSDGRAITTAGRENPHIFADGISGAGKSFKLKRLAEDAVCQGAQVIAFDYTGDFAAYMPPEGVPLRRMDVSSKELQINPLSLLLVLLHLSRGSGWSICCWRGTA